MSGHLRERLKSGHSLRSHIEPKTDIQAATPPLELLRNPEPDVIQAPQHADA